MPVTFDCAGKVVRLYSSRRFRVWRRRARTCARQTFRISSVRRPVRCQSSATWPPTFTLSLWDLCMCACSVGDQSRSGALSPPKREPVAAKLKLSMHGSARYRDPIRKAELRRNDAIMFLKTIWSMARYGLQHE